MKDVIIFPIMSNLISTKTLHVLVGLGSIVLIADVSLLKYGNQTSQQV